MSKRSIRKRRHYNYNLKVLPDVHIGSPLKDVMIKSLELVNKTGDVDVVFKMMNDPYYGSSENEVNHDH